jgi:hypothetical protein
MTTFVGGVGELYQGDLDLGRLAAEQLGGGLLGAGVVVEELHYGAVAVAQRLEELAPDALVLVGALPRRRPPGSVHRNRIRPARLSPQVVQQAVGEAVVGYVDIDLIVTVAAGFGALPARTVTIEVEPAAVDPGAPLSAAARAGLEEAVRLVREEVGRVPLLELADQLCPLVAENRLDSPAADTLRELLGQLEQLDQEGRWGTSFALRDRLRRRIAEGGTGEGMDHVDWGLWWALIEELDRLQAAEAVRI